MVVVEKDCSGGDLVFCRDLYIFVKRIYMYGS